MVVRAGGSSGHSSSRRPMGRRASFAVWAGTTAPEAANGSSAMMPGRSISDPPAAVSLPPPVRKSSSRGSGGMRPSTSVGPVSEGDELGQRSAAQRRKSVDAGMYARGSVIQPSPKLLGLMEIHDRGGAAPAG